MFDASVTSTRRFYTPENPNWSANESEESGVQPLDLMVMIIVDAVELGGTHHITHHMWQFILDFTAESQQRLQPAIISTSGGFHSGFH